jgi:hypothetical protein
VPTIRNSEEGRRLAEARWRKHREREAEEAAEAARLAELNRVVADLLRQGAEGALAEVSPSVVLAAAELGVDRATAERLADLVALFVAEAIEAAGGPEVALPTPQAWRQTVNWDALFDPDRRSRVAGAIARESAAEMAEAGGG